MARFDLMPTRSPHGGHSNIKHLPIGTSQTFKIGEAVQYSSGRIVVGVDSEGTEAENVMVAAEDAQVNGTSRTAGTLVAVYVIEPGDYLLAQNFSTDGAGTAAVVNAATIRGTNVGLVVDAGGIWYADSAATKKPFMVEDVYVKSTSAAPATLNRSQDTTTTSIAAGSFTLLLRASRDIA